MEGIDLAIACEADALSAHTLRVKLSAYSINVYWRSELDAVLPIRYLALVGKPVIIDRYPLLVSSNQTTLLTSEVNVLACAQLRL